MSTAIQVRFVVAVAEAGDTLAAALRRRVPALAWSQARRLCERGKVSVDDTAVLDGATRLAAGQTVAVDERRRALPPAGAGSIVFEDAHVVVLDKPSGVSSVPYEKREAGTAMDMVRATWRGAGRRANQTPLHIVHRIDKETSGLLAFAKTKLAERALQTLLRAHDMERTYLCVVHGQLTDRRMESRLVDDRGDGLRGSTRRLNQGKRAVTHIRVVETIGREATLCEVRLETGKTHQIRIHLSETGHPLVGERVYIRDWLAAGHTALPAERLLLHAATLGFEHPVSHAIVRLTSALPADFTSEMARLSKR